MLFSATLSSDIRALADKLLRRPVVIHIGPPNTAAKSVKQVVYEVDKSKKAALLGHLLRKSGSGRVLVFVRTRDGADRLVRQLDHDGISVAAIHGDKRQAERSRVLADFKADLIRVLVATDIASRGLDIEEMPQVINFDLPKVPEDYIHRIGRTGRAGAEGEGISLVSADEVKLLSAIESLLGRSLPREVVGGFIPTHAVPLIRHRPERPKKPKKPKITKPVTAETPAPGRTSGGRHKGSGNQPRRGAKPGEIATSKETPAEKGKERRRRITTKKR
jgi:ATP-dependent RNA helicase RhlE